MGSDTNAQYVGETDPAKIIVELCAQFFQHGWCTGTAGGMSIRHGNQIWLAPSGVQKERMRPEDMFIYDSFLKEYTQKPALYKASACTPLFHAIYDLRDAGAVIHTHSQAAVLVSRLFKSEFSIANIENIKAIPKITEPGNFSCFDTVKIPIIENTAHEEELEPDLRRIMAEYPQTSAIIVKNHGLYVWGKDVWKAKIINEAIEYLLELAIKFKQLEIE